MHSDTTHHHPALQHHFDDMAQQKDATTLGMWVFLTTEIMFFGGLFLAYIVYRAAYGDAFADASNHLDVRLGVFNTAVLIGSSLTMALAVYFSQMNSKGKTILFLILTMFLGSVFLGVKAIEYHEKYVEHHIPGAGFHYEPTGIARPAQIYFAIYFAMTGLHAFHMIIGLGLLTWLVILAWRNKFSKEYNSPVEFVGLYWHFVDIVWIFLFPLLYLIGRHNAPHH